VRQDGTYVAERDSWSRNEVVADAEEGFAVQTNWVGKKEVVVFGDRAVERVLDRKNGRIDLAVKNGLEDVGGDLAGDHFYSLAEHGQRGHVRVGASFALYRDALNRLAE
jgi:hypothetical protein